METIVFVLVNRPGLRPVPVSSTQDREVSPREDVQLLGVRLGDGDRAGRARVCGPLPFRTGLEVVRHVLPACR